MSVTHSGDGPPPIGPTVETLAPPMGRAKITVLSGTPLPLTLTDALDRPGAYILLLRRPGERLAAYVGMSGAITDRLVNHERLRPNSGTAEVIAITSDADDLERSEAAVLERQLHATLLNHADVQLLNDEPPFHGRLTAARYAQLRAFSGDALCQLAASGLITFHAPIRELLAGTELAFAEMTEAVDPAALVGAVRRRLVRNGVGAEALFLSDGSAILKAGSRVRAVEAPSLHGGISALRQEASFSGVLAQMDPGAPTLTRDLWFGTWNSMTQFAAASSSGQVGLWRAIEADPPPERDPQARLDRDEDLLSLWRRVPAPIGDLALADALKSVLSKVVPLGVARGRDAERGDLAGAVRTAIDVTNAADPGTATRVVDLAMSAVFLHAIAGDCGAVDVLDSLMFRLATKGVVIDAPIALGARL